MEVKKVRDIVMFALEHLQGEPVRVKAIGNSVHLYAGDSEFEIVVKTMDPKGPSRLVQDPITP